MEIDLDKNANATHEDENGRFCEAACEVDTQGLPFSIKVTAANISDTQASILPVDLLKKKVPRLEKITADMDYKNAFIEHVRSRVFIV